MICFVEILEKIDSFDIESQSVLVDIINKRYNQHKREVFIYDTIESFDEIEKGDFQTGTSDDLFKELRI